MQKTGSYTLERTMFNEVLVKIPVKAKPAWECILSCLLQAEHSIHMDHSSSEPKEKGHKGLTSLRINNQLIGNNQLV